MITLSIFNPRLRFDALHDLGNGDTAAHIIVEGNSPEHDPVSFRVVFHNPTPSQLIAFKMFSRPRVDDFADRDTKHINILE